MTEITYRVGVLNEPFTVLHAIENHLPKQLAMGVQVVVVEQYEEVVSVARVVVFGDTVDDVGDFVVTALLVHVQQVGSVHVTMTDHALAGPQQHQEHHG